MVQLAGTLYKLPQEQPFAHLHWSDRRRHEEHHILTSLKESASAGFQGEKRGRTCLLQVKILTPFDCISVRTLVGELLLTPVQKHFENSPKLKRKIF